MLTGLLALAILAMKLFPETPAARSLHLWMVELPVERVSRMERRHLILIAILLLCGQSLALAGSADLAMLAAWDLSTAVDAMIAVWALSVVARGKAAWAHLGRTVSRRVPGSIRRAGRARRSRAARRALNRVPANDEEGPARRAA